MYLIEYGVIFALMFLGLYGMALKPNLIKKIIALNIFQTSTFLLFIATGYVQDWRIPITGENSGAPHVNPLPHVLILTAIVVGIATTALALTLVLQIRRHYGTIDDGEIQNEEREDGA